MSATLDPAARLALDTFSLIDKAVQLLPKETKAKIARATAEEVDEVIYQIEHAALTWCGWLEELWN